MKILLTGGTGYIGSAVLSTLIGAGHEVIAVVRTETSQSVVSAAGAVALRGDAADSDWLATQLRGVDAAIHTASPNDATSADVDRAVAAAVISAFGGTEKPYLHTSGMWIWGSRRDIVEADPFDSPRLTRWRLGIEKYILNADIIASLPAPGAVYGNARGLTTLITGDQRSNGRVRVVADGSQHWTVIHVDDLAHLYLAIVERRTVRGHVIAVSGESPTVADIGRAAARGGDIVCESPDDSRARLGATFADALMLDQTASGERARELGWTPVQPSLLTMLAGCPARGLPH